MSTTSQPRIPFKGTIFVSVSACAALWLLGARAEQFSEAHGDELAALRSQVQTTDPGEDFEGIDLDSAEPIEEQLKKFMPLAGLDLGAPQGLASERAEEEPSRGILTSVEEVRAARPAGWAYPAFDAPAEGLHGPPAADLPRNVTFQVVDEIGMPVAYDTLRVFEQTVNGPIEVHTFCASAIAAEWSFGVRRLMTGATAYFLVQTELEGQTLSGTLMLKDIHTDIDVDAGRVHLRRRTEAAFGAEPVASATATATRPGE